MLTVAELTDKLEKDYLKLIIHYLKDGTLTLPDSRAMTREFLALQPLTTVAEAQQKIVEFTTKHPEFQQLQVLMLHLVEADKTQDLLSKMRSHLKNNDVDAALNLVTNSPNP